VDVDKKARRGEL